MGRFANKTEGTGPVRTDYKVEGDSGFEALGKKVPFYRRSAAYQHMKDMGCTDKEKMWDLIGRMCNFIEHDDPHMALETALAVPENPKGMLDAIGSYRLLAVLLAAEKTVERAMGVEETIPLVDP